MPDALDLLVIYGSVRPHRQGIKAAKFLVEACRGRGHQTTLIDPLEERLPLLEKMYKEYEKGQAPRSSNGWPHGSVRPMRSSSSAESTTTAFPPRSPICWITSWKSISGGHRPSFATPRAPSAAFAPRCNCARCSANLARQAFRRCYRYRACRTRSTRKAILETNPTTSAGAVPERARMVRPRTQDRKAVGGSLLNRDLHAHET